MFEQCFYKLGRLNGNVELPGATCEFGVEKTE